MKNLFFATLFIPLGLTAQTPNLFSDIRPGTTGSSANFQGHHLVKVNNRIVFGATPNGGLEGLYATTGQPGGTAQLLPSGKAYFDRGELIELNGKVYFWEGDNWWGTDGTTAGTNLITTIPTELDAPQDMTIHNGKVFFYSAVTGNLGSFDPIAETLTVYSDSIEDITQIVSTGSGLFVDGRSPSYGRELYKLNESTGLFELMADLTPGPGGSDPKCLRPAGGKLFFAGKHGSHHRPFLSDGTPAGTQVMDPTWRVYGATSHEDWGAHQIHAHQGKVYFTNITSTGTMIYVTDGTVPGTVPLNGISEIGDVIIGSTNFLYYFTSPSTLYQLPLSGGPAILVDGSQFWLSETQAVNLFGYIGINTIGDSLFFIAERAGTGAEPMIFSGNPADSARMLGDVNPGTGYSGYNRVNFVPLNGTVFMSLQDDVHGIELFCLGCAPDVPSAMNEIKQDEILVYPNPSNNQFTLRFMDSESRSVQIMDMTGRVVIQQQCDAKEIQIETASWEEGMYMYLITKDNDVQTGKVTVFH